MKRRYWNARGIRTLRRLYPNMENSAIGRKMGRSWSAIQNMAVKLGLRKTPAFMASIRFPKGMTPWNRGVTGYMGANRTSFARGNKPKNWRPIGSERINKDGHLERKVREPRKWKPVHVIVWEAAHGKVKRGQIVVFKAGISTAEKLAPVIGSLECITRAENMRRNTYHRYPKEIARLIQLRGALNRQINRRAQLEEQNRGSEKPLVRGNREGEGRRHAARPRKDDSRARAGRHQQRQGRNRVPEGYRRAQGNRLYPGRGTTRHARAAEARQA